MCMFSFSAKGEKTLFCCDEFFYFYVQSCFFFYFSNKARFNEFMDIYSATREIVSIPLRHHQDFLIQGNYRIRGRSPYKIRNEHFMSSSIFVGCCNYLIHFRNCISKNMIANHFICLQTPDTSRGGSISVVDSVRCSDKVKQVIPMKHFFCPRVISDLFLDVRGTLVRERETWMSDRSRRGYTLKNLGTHDFLG